MSVLGPTSSAQRLNRGQVNWVRQHLKEILASRTFAVSKRSQDFLSLIVDRALAGEWDSLRERMIGVEMFGRSIDYDTANDSVVRVTATEVRKKLAQYYLEANGNQRVSITIPSGSYVPVFSFESPAAVARAQPEPVPSTPEKNGAVRPAEEYFRTSRDLAKTTGRIRMRGSSRIRRLLVGISIALGLISIAGYIGYMKWSSASKTRSAIRSIAVLPFANLSGDPQQDYFADGMTEELIADLGQAPPLQVISRTSAMSYKGSKKELPEIARELGVDGIVEGSVLRSGNQVRITARLVDARTDRSIWDHTFVRDSTNILTVQGELAKGIAEQVSTSLTPQAQAHFAHPTPVSTKAEDQYMRGMLRISANDPHSALGYFQAAIAADPDFAQPHAALADCYGRMGESGMFSYADAFSKQKAEALKAVQLDDSLPEAHAQLAEAAMNLDWDWATAAKEYNRALALNPSSAPVHESYGIYLERIGKLSEAIAESERGVELDPVGARSFWNAGTAYYYARQYERALPLAQKAQVLNVNIASGSFILGQIYAEKGMYAKSISEFQKLGDSPHVMGHLGNAYARNGQTDSARKIIAKLEENMRKDSVGGYEIALIYAALGNKNEAFKWLEESYRVHSYGLEHLKIDPCLDPLRSDPRFDALVQRVGYPQ